MKPYPHLLGSTSQEGVPEPGEEQKGRPGGPGDIRTAREVPSSSSRSSSSSIQAVAVVESNNNEKAGCGISAIRCLGPPCLASRAIGLRQCFSSMGAPIVGRLWQPTIGAWKNRKTRNIWRKLNNPKKTYKQLCFLLVFLLLVPFLCFSVVSVPFYRQLGKTDKSLFCSF